MRQDAHQARAAQYHGAEVEYTGEPGYNSEAVRRGLEQAPEIEPPLMTKAQAMRNKGAKAGMFHAGKYRCWMTGNGSRF